jgi:hypothetical protein
MFNFKCALDSEQGTQPRLPRGTRTRPSGHREAEYRAPAVGATGRISGPHNLKLLPRRQSPAVESDPSRGIWVIGTVRVCHVGSTSLSKAASGMGLNATSLSKRVGAHPSKSSGTKGPPLDRTQV